MNKKLLRLFFLLMSFVLIFSGGQTALAQDEDEVTLEEIIVTGSRLERTDITSVSPISVFSAADIELTGQPTMEDFVQNLPSISGALRGKTVNNGNRGYATASMRGLGAGRTLVLVNGKRMTSIGTGTSVDLNMIPIGMIERVEVLRDGAATAYGSDAIAGVINVITKSDFEGADFNFQYDVTDEHDGRMRRASGVFGASSDRGNIVFGLDYTERATIWQRDREFSACPYAEDENSIYCSGSGTTYPGHFWTDTGSNAGYILEDGVIVDFDDSVHAYNYAAASYMVTPQEVLSTFINGRYDLVQESPFGTVTATMDALWSNRKSDQLMAAVGTFWTAVMPMTSPYNPTVAPLDALDAVPDSTVYVARRLFETGGRGFTQDATTYRLVVGLEGELNNGWNWDASWNYSRWMDSQIIYGQANKVNSGTVMDPDLCAADPACPEVWDPLNVGTLTQEIQDYILVDHSPVSRNTMTSLQINMTGDLGGYALWGGPIQWAIGYEVREAEALWQPDGAATLDLIYYVAANKEEGSYRVSEQYGELRVPIIEDEPFADMLAAEISVRRSNYDALAESTTNWKYALEYGPIPSLRFRSVYTEGFRAPSINERFFPQSLSAQTYSDPCENYATSGVSATVVANCQADGLAGDFNLGTYQATSIFGGNPNLEPEESESLTIGVVIAPENLPNFTLSIDYYKIEIENAIGTAGTNNVIDGCYNSANFSSPWCAYMVGPTHPLVGATPSLTSPRRNANQQISGILLNNANLASYETSGIDFAASYIMEFGDFSSINLSVMASKLDDYTYTPYEGATPVQMAGMWGEDPWELGPATFPEWKVNFNFQYNMGDEWSFSWAPRWFSDTEDLNGSPGNLQNTAEGLWYHDVQANYNWKNMTFTLGARNVTDEDPPYVTNYDDMNTIQFSYDTAGRYYYAGVRISF